MTKGQLEHVRDNHITCVDCDTDYPEQIGFFAERTGKATCNEHEIDKCPWCRPDSKPWMYGRGA